jgi:cytoskeleton protein RodZ
MSTEEGDNATSGPTPGASVDEDSAGRDAVGEDSARKASVGTRLAAARAVTGLSIAQVAQRLHCGPDLIEALEDDRFADLGAPVFARGHLRRYSELLGLPIDDMLAQLAHQENRDPPLPDLTQVPRAQTSLDLRTLRPVLAGVSAVVVFALLIWLVLTQTTPESESPPTQAAAVTPESTEPTADPAAAAAAPSAVDEALAEVRPEAPPEVAPQAAPQPAPEVTPEATSETPTTWPARASVIAQRGGFSLALSVTESCWIEIYDKDNNPLFYDMAQPGRRIQVSGAAPIRIRLGLAEVVSLEFLGRRTPVPAGLIRESLAHFTLAADGTFRRYRPPAAAESATEPRPSGT